MTIQAAPYYWVSCDAPGCTARCPDVMDEYSAFADISGALETADASDWRHTDDSRDYCENHALNVCDQCQAYDDTPLAGEREYLCVKHWNESEATA